MYAAVRKDFPTPLYPSIIILLCGSCKNSQIEYCTGVGSGKPKSVNELVKYIGGKKVFIPKRPGEPNITHADISNINKLLKWKSKISLKEGITKVLKEINYWKKAPLWTPKKIEKTMRIWFKYLK